MGNISVQMIAVLGYTLLETFLVNNIKITFAFLDECMYTPFTLWLAYTLFQSKCFLRILR